MSSAMRRGAASRRQSAQPAPARALSPPMPAPPRSKRKAAPAAASLNEGVLSGEAGAGVVAQAIAWRKEYERWHTELLATWLIDWGVKLPKSMRSDREHIIIELVSRSHPPPREGKQQQEFTRVWRRVSKASAQAVPPGPLHMAEGQPQLPSVPAGVGHVSLSDGEEEEEEASSEDDAASPVSVAKKAKTQHVSVAAPGAAAAAAASKPVAHVGLPSEQAEWGEWRTCLTCGELAPEHAKKGAGAFRCAGCFRRGDLEHSHPLNVQLMEERKRSVAPASSSGSSSLGQSHTQGAGSLAAADSHLNALERHFEKELKRLPAQQGAFVRGGVPQPFTHQQAIAEVRKAFKASQTEAPSEQLVALIRAGGLANVGFAIPRLLAQARRDDDQAASAIHIVGGVLTAGSAAVAPPVESLQSFCAALFGTILPSLVDNPRAIAQWCALGRTALEFERDDGGWKGAHDYIEQLLHERITTGTGEYASVSDSVRIAVQSSFTRQRGNAPQQQQQAPASGKKSEQGSACRQFNMGVPCRRTPCRLDHVCWMRSCRGAHSLALCSRAGAEGERKRLNENSFQSAPASVHTSSSAPPAAAPKSKSKAKGDDE